MKCPNFLPAVFACLGVILAAPKAGAQTLKPESLRCEYRQDPMGTDTAQPRLSWILLPTAPQLRGLMQTSYEILASSTPELLAADKGDLWNSGKVVSSQINQINYGGKTLKSNQLVYWKVRVWDQAGAPSPWSPVARWTMGVLSEADWQGAKWIGAPDANAPFAPDGAKERKEKYETVLLRRELAVKPGLYRALVHVCGLAQYEMTLNGAKIGDALLTPGWTAYDKTCLYDSYDITKTLKAGPNAVGIFLGNGFYNVHGERYTKVRGSYGNLQAIALIRLEYADGTVENVVTDGKWRTSSGPITFSSIYGGEDYDARLAQKGWDVPGFDASRWEQPATTKGPGGVLRGLSAAAPPIREMQVLKPVGKKQISPNVDVYDFGQNAAIMAAIKVKGVAGSTVKITPSEIISDNGDINERMNNNESYCTYTLSGSGEESYMWKFYYRGGRYLRVETGGVGGTLPEVTSIESRVIRSDTPVVGQFATSNTLVNKIYGIVRWAQMSNMMSVMTDCPHREKLGWLEETQLNGPALRYNFDMSGLFSKVVNDMADAQRANGLVPSLVPNYYRWDEGKFTTPIQWGSAFILVPWQQYEFEGDTKMLKDRYEGMKHYMEYLNRRSENNIVSFGLGDWYDNLSEGEPTLTPVGLTDTAFFFQDYKIMAKIAAILGKPDDVAQFERRADDVRKAFNEKYFDPATGNYASGAQGSNCLPLSMNLADPSQRPRILQNLVDDLSLKGTTAGEVSFRYLLRALAEEGRSDFIYTTYTSETNGYGLQVKLGKTTLTEAWNGGNSSQNHFMFGQINEWYFHDLAGIQAASPGFEQIVIKPSLVGDLTWVKAAYRSIRGNIVSDWMHGPSGLTMNVTIPAGSKATIFVPAGNAGLVKESGSLATKASGLKFLRMEKGAAVFDAGSGSYSFSSADAAASPARVTATARSGQVMLSWTPSVNGITYILRRSTTPRTGYVALPNKLTTTTYLDKNVQNGASYYYAVSAVNELGESRPSEVSATPALILNSGFEEPKIGGFVVNPTSAGWTFTSADGSNASGITRNGSGYTDKNPKIIEGEQAAFLQGRSIIKQAISGLKVGLDYTLTFSAAQRANSSQVGQSWQVKLGDKVIGNFPPDQSKTAFTQFSVKFKATGDSGMLSFVGTNSQGGDNTVLIDSVRLVDGRH